jgi:transposase InsO family protein
LSRQSYYKRKRSVCSKQALAADVVSKVVALRRLMPRLGTRKLHYMLSEELSVGRDKLFDILRANHMLVSPRRVYRTTTNSHHIFHKHKNIVADLDIVRPEQVWVSDITYLGASGKHSYLSLVTDAYSKKDNGI